MLLELNRDTAISKNPSRGIAQRTVVQKTHCIATPDGVSDTTLAALVDPGFSAWAAL
jgi:NADPH:quinone reductase-like Zn-dependent oxidoreductase